MRIAFVGGGLMAEAMIGGLLAKDVIESREVTVSDISPERCSLLVEKYGVNFQQILELREQWKGLQIEYEGVGPQIEILRKEYEENKPGQPVEEDVRAAICKYLDEFRQLLVASGKNQ